MARAGRGRYKIFLGMAAGVGKTYRMLQEGQAEAEAGRDVVLAYLEPHDRAETVAQAEGLERLPRRRVTYRDTEIEEMDLPAIFRRAPDLCLIDELAHTNAPGLEHAKRYEDIDDVLDAGIDVFSTVNVQHLESLNDRVAELTGVRVRETFPDTVLTAADEVVLIDLTPEALIERLRAGKIYPAERIEASLNNFFRIENLAVLRELALRQTAEEVEAKSAPARPADAVGTREQVIEAAPQAVAERALALVRRAASSQRLVRRAWRSAQRLGADLDLLYVRRPRARRRRRSASSSGRSEARLGTRRAPAGRGGRRRRRRRRRRRGRARHHLRADRPAAAAHRCCPPARVAARAADPQDARRRRADRRRPSATGRRGGAVNRILFPFLGSVLSERTLEATLRLARAQNATLIPAYLALVPRTLSLEAPLGAECDGALALLEVIEQRAAREGVAVDSRIVRGRTTRQAIGELIADEQFDALVIPARSSSDGLDPADVAWVLESAPAEVLVLRPEVGHSATHAV